MPDVDVEDRPLWHTALLVAATIAGSTVGAIWLAFEPRIIHRIATRRRP